MATWDSLTDRLTSALTGLADDERVTVMASGTTIELRRQDTYLYAECTGESPGADPDAGRAAFLALGWNVPPQVGAHGFVRHFPADDGAPPSRYADDGVVEEAVALVVRTLRELGGPASPDGIDLTNP
ncbi:TY-Chap domain-containing protein [Georgenia faecalis]|uniref:TY-Chap domain-containing protein n=1 Tax=Georgenia faecalis TaxID=2483799 RepID=UPI000FD84DB0|nr:hypothetical protein [Georgenia faecalis]